MSDLIRREDAIDALLEKGQRSKRYRLGDIWELNFSEIIDAINSTPSTDIIQCKDCKWWKKDESLHPLGLYGYCYAMRHGYFTERWDIGIYRKCKEDFFCADAEPKTNEDDEDDEDEDI